jgi:hypothetical protein
VKDGDRVRVTLARGELDCDVVSCQLPDVSPTTRDKGRAT